MHKFLLLFVLLTANRALADMPVVVGATAERSGATWTISATLGHADTGWDHYADGWRVETPSGETLGYRELLHPHVNEQPFTRSLGGVVVPDALTALVIRPHDSVHGWGEGYQLALPE